MRTIHHRVYGVPAERSDELAEIMDLMAGSREWRGDTFWSATAASSDLFAMEYFRHARDEEGPNLSAAGFLRLGGDETDALATLYFLADISARFGCETAYRDRSHALAKLRFLEFRSGLLPNGKTLDEVIGSRPVIKRVGPVAVTFYPPLYWSVVHPDLEREPEKEWAYSVHGMRARAAGFLEAEAEAMKLVNGFNRLP